MSPIYAIIVMAFINGNPIDDPVVLMGDEAHNLTAQSCPKWAAEVIDHVRKEAGPDVQFVAKCVDLAQLPSTVSAFGSKVK
jgi:hypothetical protein